MIRPIIAFNSKGRESNYEASEVGNSEEGIAHGHGARGFPPRAIGQALLHVFFRLFPAPYNL
ncbi:MAG TPA: hypothetical protein VEN79_13775 [Terriglobia bacterium]|nr:hypothetical protein [Terriglobia bacterium]